MKETHAQKPFTDGEFFSFSAAIAWSELKKTITENMK